MPKLHKECNYAFGSAVLVRENVGNIWFVCFPHSLLPCVVPHVPLPPHVVDDGDLRLNGYLDVLARELWFKGKVVWSSFVFFSAPLPLSLPFVIVLPLIISANFDSNSLETARSWGGSSR